MGNTWGPHAKKNNERPRPFYNRSKLHPSYNLATWVVISFLNLEFATIKRGIRDWLHKIASRDPQSLQALTYIQIDFLRYFSYFA